MKTVAVPVDVLVKMADHFGHLTAEHTRLEGEVAAVKQASVPAAPSEQITKAAEALVDVLIEKNLIKNAAARGAKVEEYVKNPSSIFADFEKFASKIEVRDVPAVGLASGVKAAGATSAQTADERLAERVLGTITRG